jgi:hypothetical protein
MLCGNESDARLGPSAQWRLRQFYCFPAQDQAQKRRKVGARHGCAASTDASAAQMQSLQRCKRLMMGVQSDGAISKDAVATHFQALRQCERRNVRATCGNAVSTDATASHCTACSNVSAARWGPSTVAPSSPLDCCPGDLERDCCPGALERCEYRQVRPERGRA